MKMEMVTYLDTILVPLSLFVLIAYHAYLWLIFKTRPSHTTMGIESLRRRIWFLDIEGDGRKAMLAVQSLRNSQMVAIFTASTAIAFSLALAALTNNAYNANHLFVKTSFFGLQSGRIFALKYGLASFLLLFSLLCSSMATGFMIDAIFLLNGSADQFSPSGITQILFERGYMLAFIGNRLLCFSFPLLLWLFGPVSAAVSSLALVWWLKELDFVGKFTKSNMIA